MLSINNLHVAYGSIKALKGIHMTVAEGSIVALLGANGAGKTTTLKTLSGIARATQGSISFRGQPITNWDPAKITSLGIVQSPEGRQVFADISVAENLRIGAFTLKSRQTIRDNFQRVYRYFPVLQARQTQLAGTLSGGEQQMLAIGRALMASPKLLLLDEPSLGLAPLIVKSIFQIIKDINAEGTTVLIIEQNALSTLKIAHHAYVLSLGEIILEGPAHTLTTNKQLIDAYLGGTPS